MGFSKQLPGLKEDPFAVVENMNVPVGVSATPKVVESSTVAVHDICEPATTLGAEHETTPEDVRCVAFSVFEPNEALGKWSRSPPYDACREMGPSLPAPGMNIV
jgi:hypothetical protein